MTEKVVFLITDLELGGSPLVVRRICRGLREGGNWRPTVVSIKSPGVVGRWIRHEGVDVFGLHAHHPRDWSAARRWLGLLHEIRPHVVVSVLIHANALAAACAPLAPRCVYLQSIHTLAPEPRWHWRLQGFIAGRCEGIIAPSRAILRRIAAFGPFAQGFVTPNGIDLERFTRAAALPPEKRPWPAGARVVGYIGRFDPVKRLDLLIRAAARLIVGDYTRWENLYVALVGYGPEEKRLRTLAARLGVASHVAFCGATNIPETLYKCFDVLCLPSVVEGFGMTIIEAMAAGVPVLACRSPALEEIIVHGANGWLVQGASPHAISEGIAQILNNAALRERLKVGAGATVQNFTAEKMVAGYEKILRNFSSLPATR